MNGILFQRGNELIKIMFNSHTINIATNGMGVENRYPINSLKFSKEGVIKEFPDLKDDKDWKAKAIERFHVKFRKLSTDQDRENYLIKDLGKHGYIAIYKQKQGHRVIKVNGTS